MKSLITRKMAERGLLFILSFFVLFHLLILTGIIPFGIVWGGKLNDHSQMQVMEAISIMINLIMLAIVAIKAGIIKLSIKPVLLRGAFWVMAVIFSLNTIGNLISQNRLEKLFFTPLTLILALLCIRLAIDRNIQEKTTTDPY